MKAVSLFTLILLPLSGPSDEKKVGRMVHYSGRVQGVGFRAAAVNIAKDYPVTGWVKNLKDGRVQLLVEGPERGVTDFLAAIRKSWGKDIEKEDVKKVEPSGDYRDFKMMKD